MVADIYQPLSLPQPPFEPEAFDRNRNHSQAILPPVFFRNFFSCKLLEIYQNHRTLASLIPTLSGRVLIEGADTILYNCAEKSATYTKKGRVRRILREEGDNTEIRNLHNADIEDTHLYVTPPLSNFLEEVKPEN